MKLYTSNDQTAKLIELGFEKPKSEVKAEQAGDCAWYNPAYCIGELLSFLPRRTFSGSVYIDYNGLWRVGYENTVFHQSEFELIDALYFMCVLLKEEGVI